MDNHHPWTARELALATVIAILLAVVALLATEGLANMLLVTGDTQ